ncbi:MAG TPA: hypothetical protein VGG42_09835 [Acidobacteriaceae bacterium]|jgi:hypothetical protein
MKRILNLVVSVLALGVLVPALSAQIPQSGVINQPLPQQVGGIGPDGQVYYAALVHAEQGLFSTSLTVGLVNPATAPTGVPSYNGGTVAAGSNYFECVAVDWAGNYTLPSPESSVVTTAFTGSVQVTCPVVAHAAYYQVWVAASSGAEANYFTTPAGANIGTMSLPIASNTAGTINTTASAGMVLIYGVQAPRKFVLSAAYTNATATGTTIFTIPVLASTSYTIHCAGLYKAASGGAFTLGTAGPASPTLVTYNYVNQTALSTAAPTYLNYNGTGTSYPTGLDTTAVTTAATYMPFDFTLMLTNGTTAGNVTVTGATISTNTLTVAPGSYCQAY